MAYPRFPGPMGAGLVSPVIDKGTLAKIASAVPGTVDEQSVAQPADAGTTKARAIDIEKAVAHLDKHAHSTSQGQCAKYVRQAIEAGGVTIPPPRPLYAKDYGPTLIALGFAELNAEGYVAEKGDVGVFQPPSGQTAGHIQMHNGTTWVSDFIQGSGIYPGPAYRKEKVAYVIYRP